ncbi:MAG: polyphenol oxidase family protein [Cucumibacter sp.]
MIPRAETAAILSGLPGVTHAFFGRRGGVSTGPFASLNCSFSQGDAPKSVADNRATILAAIGVASLAIARQMHSSEAIAVSAPFPEDRRPPVDGLVAATPGLALGILTADCVPILLADPRAKVIGACHAGWRGAVGGFVGATIAAMLDLGAEPARIRAAIGPAISAANYEVGPDWAGALLARDPANARYLSTPAGGREHFDLPRFVLDLLEGEGIVAPELVGGCTYASPDRYFSHRLATHRGTGCGRQLAVIALLP